MADEKKKTSMFEKIASRDDALKVTKDCGNGFFVIAAIQGGIGAFIAPTLLFDAAIYAACGYFICYKQNRIAAIVVLLFSGIALFTTLLNKLGKNVGGGNNIFLAVIIAIAAVRSVEATFKLHGRFKEVPLHQ